MNGTEMIETFVYSETNVCGCYVIGDSYVFILQLAVSLVKFCKWTKSAFYFNAKTYNCISIYCKVKLVLMKLYKNCLIKIGGWTHSAIPLRRQMHNMTENISWNIPLCSDGHSLISFKIFLGMETTVSREKMFYLFHQLFQNLLDLVGRFLQLLCVQLKKLNHHFQLRILF